MFFSRALQKRHSVLPGLDLALGFTRPHLGFIVLIPLSTAFPKSATVDALMRRDAVASSRVLANDRLSIGACLAAVLSTPVATPTAAKSPNTGSYTAPTLPPQARPRRRARQAVLLRDPRPGRAASK